MVILKSVLTSNFSQPTINQVRHGKRFTQQGYVIPGQKLCSKCRLTYSKSKTDIDQIETNDSESDDMITYEKEIYLNTTKESLNNTLYVFDISPVKVHSVATHSKLALGKKKLKQVEDVITKKLVSVVKVDQTELKEEYVQNNIPAETQSKANDLGYLVACMKDKLKISNRRKRLQILTFGPKLMVFKKSCRSIFSF